MNAIDDRFQVCCSCCGFVEGHRRKREAVKRMIEHMSRHELSEIVTFDVYDLMAIGGGKTIYGGAIERNMRSHGIGVGYAVR